MKKIAPAQPLFLLLFLLLSLTVRDQAQANSACTQKLRNVQWPLDCFMLLKVRKIQKNNRKYSQINEWCKIHEEGLLKKAPPSALFKLYMPKDCLQTALKARGHQNSQRILEGTFLKFFP